MANFMDQIKQQWNKLQAKINKWIEDVKNWPQYRKIGVGIMLLGLILLIIGILLY